MLEAQSGKLPPRQRRQWTRPWVMPFGLELLLAVLAEQVEEVLHVGGEGGFEFDSFVGVIPVTPYPFR